MIGILKFKLPEDRGEFEAAQKGGAYKGALQELDNYLRGRLKYEELTEEVSTALQAVRDKLHEECDDIWS